MHALALPTDDLARETPNVPASRDSGSVPVNGDIFTGSEQGDNGALDADTRHRREFARYASQDGHQPYRHHLARIYAEWEGWNGRFFDNRLLPPHLLIAEPKSPRALGDHSPFSGWGSTNQIRVRPSILNGTHPLVRPGDDYAEGRLLLTLDIALHETLHQYATEILGQREESYRGHGPIFRDLCNRIGEALDLPPVRTAKARGSDRDRPSCAEWPLNVRPKGYYLGAYLPHEEKAAAGPGEPSAPPAPPKLLADWLRDHPEWADLYRAFGAVLFKALDEFFAVNEAPPAVQEQAVMLWAKAYRHHIRTRPARRPGLPARIGA